MKLEKAAIFLFGLVLVLAAGSLAMSLIIYASLPGDTREDTVALAKQMAGELADNNLPEAAIEEYEKVLDSRSLTAPQAGAIHYLIGNLYYEDLGDYEQAAAHYIRARALDENASYTTEAGKKLITCLEKMGRRLAARRELDQQTSLEPDSAAGRDAGKIVARVGSSDISKAQFNRFLETLPPDMQGKLSDPSQRRALLDQMIGRELIYHAALREGLDKEAELKRNLRDLEKEVLIQYYTRGKIAPTVKPDTAELTLYFNANKEKYGEKEFDEVRDQVLQDYIAYIGQKAVNEYIGTLMKAEPVQVFEENLK